MQDLDQSRGGSQSARTHSIRYRGFQPCIRSEPALRTCGIRVRRAAEPRLHALSGRRFASITGIDANRRAGGVRPLQGRGRHQSVQSPAERWSGGGRRPDACRGIGGSGTHRNADPAGRSGIDAGRCRFTGRKLSAGSNHQPHRSSAAAAPKQSARHCPRESW